MSFRNVIVPLAPAGGAEPPLSSQVAPTAVPATLLQFDDPEITELARSLRNDPDLIYEYVHDNITTLPQYGSLKGPLGTVLDQCGTCVDQAELMMALLSCAGFAPKAVIGQITLNAAQLSAWLGTDTGAASIGSILGTGGFAYFYTPGPSGSILDASMNWVWVKVAIDGVDYVFDPATKNYVQKPGLSNIGTLLAYNRTTFLEGALSGAVVNPNDIRSLNKGNVRSSLNGFSNALVTALDTQFPDAGPDDILGGASVVPLALNTRKRDISLNYALPLNEDTEIPARLRTTVTVTLPGAAAATFNSSDIYGRRLSLFFNASIAPVLSLDGVPHRTGSPITSGQNVSVQIAIVHPYPTTFADQNGAQSIRASPGGAFIVSTGFGPVGRGMIERHRRLLQQNTAANPSNPSAEPVLGESLAMLGYTWLAQVGRTQQLADRLGNTSTIYQHAVGIVGMAALLPPANLTGPFVDLPFNFLGIVQRTGRPNTSGPTASEAAVFFTLAQMSSVLESGAIEQTQPGVAAVSTVKLLELANTSGQAIYDITSVAIFDAVRPQLAGYSSVFLDALRARIVQGYRAVIPQNGQIPVNQWTGSGHFEISASGDAIGALISGGLSGGFSTVDVPPAQVNANLDLQAQPPSISPTLTVPGIAGGGDSSGVVGTIGDPVNPVTGSYVYSMDDLTVGSGAFPYALSFQRSYDSGRSGSGGTLGAGWRHNFDLTVVLDSDGFEGMAAISPRGGAPSIATIYVLLDIMNTTGAKPLANIVIASLVGQYWMELLTDNVRRVTRPGATENFIRLPTSSGGTMYGSPIGSASRLTANTNGTYTLRTVEGVTINFAAATATVPGTITSWTSAAGASVAFTYTSGKLTKVQNNLGPSNVGRRFDLAYNAAGLLASVADATGRTTSYQYDADARLASVTDPLAKVTRYEYDAGGRLAKIFYPARPAVAFITLAYDALGRVSTQTDAGGRTTELFVAGRRTELLEPPQSTGAARNRHVWYFDPLGRATAEVLDYGRDASGVLLLNLTTTRAYDGQSRLVRTTLPEGNRVEMTYDKYSFPLTVRRVAKPGSGQADLVQQFVYASTAGREIFRQVKDATDPRGNKTSYTYSPTGLLASIKLPAVARPDTPGLVNPTQTFAHMTSGPAIGLIEQEVDAEGRVTTYEYDTGGNLSARTADAGAGRLNLKTTYVSDAVGNVIETVSPRGNVAGANPADFKTTITYDAKRRRTAEEQLALDVRTFTTYDADDRVTEVKRLVTPASGSTPAVYQITTTTYTLSGQPLKVTDAAGTTVTNTYNGLDRLLSVTLGGGRQTLYVYDVLSRVTSIRDRVSGTLDPTIVVNRGTVVRETRTYTANGQLATSRDGKNNLTSFEYDGFDRLTKVTHAGGSTETTTYDANGNALSRKTRAGETINLTYDALNRVLTRDVPGNANAGMIGYSYAYDLTGRTLFVGQTGDAVPMAFGYDTAGRLAIEIDADGRAVGYFHDEDSNRIAVTWPEAGAQAYQAFYVHDALSRVSQVLENAAGVRQLAGYAYDRLSRRTAVVRLNTTSTIYAYRPNNPVEFIRHEFAGGVQADFLHFYNSENALIGREINDAAYRPGASNPGLALGSTAYTTNTLNQYTAAGGTALSYDGNGNLTGDGVWTYGYDPQNRLVSAAKTAGGAVTIAYSYDAVGRRRSRTRNTVKTSFLWAGAQEIAEYNAAGALVRRHVPGPGLDEPVAAVTPSPSVGRRFNHADALGSVVAVSFGNGTIAEKFAYTPYGVADSNAGSSMRFTGRRLDADTGLYDLRARDYSPMLGRFLQPDPIGMAGGINLYAYVGNSPVNATDPSGLVSFWGTVRFLGGVAEATVGLGLGAVTGWTGIGGVAGVAVALHGIDTAVAAWQGTDSVTSQGLQAAGVSQAAANAIDAGLSGAAGIAAGARVIPYSLVTSTPPLAGGGGGTSLLSAAARGYIPGVPPIATGQVTADSGALWQGAQAWVSATGRNTTNQAAIIGQIGSQVSVASGATTIGTAAARYLTADSQSTRK